MSYLENKRLLILAGAEVHCKVVRKAKSMGIYTIVTDYLDYADSPAKQIADEYWNIDIMDIDTIVEKCRTAHVDGVLAFCIDPAQVPYYKVCNKLGVPCYGTKEQFDIMTSKKLFKKVCLESGVDVIPEYSEKEIDEGKVEYPIFVKPSESRGSRGQSICYNYEEAKVAIALAKKESADGKCLIEKYMKGRRDFSLAYIVIDSEPYITKMGDRYLGREEDDFQRQHICTLLPSSFANDFEKNVNKNIKKLVENIGLKFGAIFLQGFIDGDTVRFYDPGLRFPGSDYDIALENATGFSTVETMIEYALTGNIKSCAGNPVDCYKLNGKTAMILSIAAGPGKIAKLNGIDDVMRDDRVVAFYQNHTVGDVISKTGDIHQRIIEFVALVENREEAKALAKKIYDSVEIEDDKGIDMRISKMGIDIEF